MSDKKDVSEIHLAQVMGIRPEVLNPRELTPLEQMVHEMSLAEKKPAEFLNAWKEGMAVIGESYFSIESATVGEATEKWDLRPDMQLIEQALGPMSGGKRIFLIEMCQFYCDSDVKRICHDLRIEVPSLADFANLDEQHRSILTRLMNSYTGW